MSLYYVVISLTPMLNQNQNTMQNCRSREAGRGGAIVLADFRLQSRVECEYSFLTSHQHTLVPFSDVEDVIKE